MADTLDDTRSSRCRPYIPRFDVHFHPNPTEHTLPIWTKNTASIIQNHSCDLELQRGHILTSHTQLSSCLAALRQPHNKPWDLCSAYICISLYLCPSHLRLMIYLFLILPHSACNSLTLPLSLLPFKSTEGQRGLVEYHFNLSLSLSCQSYAISLYW